MIDPKWLEAKAREIQGKTCKNSADFVEDIMYGHLPETLYVGSILDYHV